MQFVFAVVGFVASFAAVVAAILTTLFRMLERQWWWQDGEQSDEIEDAAYSVVEASIRKNSDEWEPSSGGHYLRNKKRGISLWVANGADSLGIDFNGLDANPRSGAISTVWRKRLYKATQLHALAQVVAKFGES